MYYSWCANRGTESAPWNRHLLKKWYFRWSSVWCISKKINVKYLKNLSMFFFNGPYPDHFLIVFISSHSVKWWGEKMFALTSPTSLETFGLLPLKSLGSDFSRCFVRKYVHFGVLCTLNITASGIELSNWRMVSTYSNCLMTYDKYRMILGNNSCLQNMRQLLTKHFCFRFGFSFPYSSWSPGMYPEFKQLICIWLLLMSY